MIRGEDPNTIPAPESVIRKNVATRIKTWISNSLGFRSYRAVLFWTSFAGIAGAVILLSLIVGQLLFCARRKKRRTYDDIVRNGSGSGKKGAAYILPRLVLMLSAFCTLIYLCWRVVYTVPAGRGAIAVGGNLLRRTVNGCRHMKYPDPAKVHIWICDDNRRAEMRRLAEEMGVGYFDRPDNEGAKAGNLRLILIFQPEQAVSFLILLYWIIRIYTSS